MKVLSIRQRQKEQEKKEKKKKKVHKPIDENDTVNPRQDHS